LDKSQAGGGVKVSKIGTRSPFPLAAHGRVCKKIEASKGTSGEIRGANPEPGKGETRQKTGTGFYNKQGVSQFPRK